MWSTYIHCYVKVKYTRILDNRETVFSVGFVLRNYKGVHSEEQKRPEEYEVYRGMQRITTELRAEGAVVEC
jgi:hypothetical protein